jgi:hypothetical protein
MRSFIVACIAAAIIATGAAFVLNHYQESAEMAFKTGSVRI